MAEIVPGDVAKALINMVTERSTAQERAAAYEHITHELYTERGRLVAFLASVYPSRIGPDPDEPEWYVVTVDAPTGQMCWHVSDTDRMDRHLFDHIRPAVPSDAPWDGHTTPEKYERLAELVGLNDAAPWDTNESFLDRAERGALLQVLGGVRAVLDSPRVHGGRYASPDLGDEVVYMVPVKDIEAALAGQPVAMAAPGPLRWKFDGGRGAMLNLNNRIVGYYTPSGLKMPERDVLQAAVYDALTAGLAPDGAGRTVLASTFAELLDGVVDAVTTKIVERNS